MHILRLPHKVTVNTLFSMGRKRAVAVATSANDSPQPATHQKRAARSTASAAKSDAPHQADCMGTPGAPATPQARQQRLPAGVQEAVAPPAGSQPLMDLGGLQAGTVIKRPSASVRTPYVADVRLAVDGEQVLAHTPALDCAGMISPGRRVYMRPNVPKPGAAATKTSHSVQLCEELRETGDFALVGSHPATAEQLARIALEGHLIPELGEYERVKSQRRLGDARFDFVLEGDQGADVLVEVKCVVCADYPAGGVPTARSQVGVYTSSAVPYERTAIFPHGAKKREVGVVSDRAIKHLNELTLLHQRGRDDDGRPLKCAVLFIVNRSDCTAFRPCHEACMMFAQMLRRAQAAGVQVLAYDIAWQLPQGTAFWGKRLPVVYGEGVSTEVDAEHLSRVLHFNSTDPRTHWKRGASGKSTAPRKAAAAGRKRIKAAQVDDGEQLAAAGDA